MEPSRYRCLLLAFYEKHNPAKSADVDNLLWKYRGKEAKLFAALRRKYPGSALLLKEDNVDSQGDADAAAIPSCADLMKFPVGLNEKEVNDQRAVDKHAEVVPQKQGSSGKGRRTLPAGFFDNAADDVSARGVAAEAERRDNEESDWRKFAAFSASLQNDAGRRSRESAEESAREGLRFKNEQNDFRSLIANLKRKRKRMLDATSISSSTPSSPPSSTFSSHSSSSRLTAEVNRFTNSSGPRSQNSSAGQFDLKSILAGRYKKQRRDTKARKQADFLPLDPFDWRGRKVD